MAAGQTTLLDAQYLEVERSIPPEEGDHNLRCRDNQDEEHSTGRKAGGIEVDVGMDCLAVHSLKGSRRGRSHLVVAHLEQSWMARS